MKILVINGPNLNLLGKREVQIYGTKTLSDIEFEIQEFCSHSNISVVLKQSNHEGVLVDIIQEALVDKVDGIVINAAAYAHTSIAILDALKAVSIPYVVVHITNPMTRESFRHRDILAEHAVCSVVGKGDAGYLEAIKLIGNFIEQSK